MKDIDVFDDGREKKVLVFVIKDTSDGDHKVLMGYHVKQEHMNFPGGGVEANETSLEAASRELWEEAGLKGEDFRKLGNMIFRFPNEHMIDMDIFVCRPIGEFQQEHEGKETGLQELAYYDINNLPYERMWPTDAQWLQYAFEGVYFNGMLEFETDMLEISRMPELRVV